MPTPAVNEFVFTSPSVDPTWGVIYGGVDDPNGENDELNAILLLLTLFNRGSAVPACCGARPNPVGGGGEKNRGGDAA